jgi:hypothetical protein
VVCRAIVVALASVAVGGCAAESSESPGPSVNEAKYRAAVQKAADCTAEKGWNVSPVEREIDGTLNFSMNWDTEPPEQESRQAEEDYLACKEEHLMVTGAEQEYIDSMRLTGADWNQAYREMVSCLEDAEVTGIVVGDAVDKVVDAIPLDNIAANECFSEYRLVLFGNSME